MLLFGRVALLAYGIGLILVIIHNIFGGRENFHRPKSEGMMTLLIILMFVKGVLIYLSVIAIGYWAVVSFGWFWGLLSAIGALLFQFQIGQFVWRRF
jgi:hypothetical protein